MGASVSFDRHGTQQQLFRQKPSRTRHSPSHRHETLTGGGAPLVGRALVHFFLCAVQIHVSGVAMKSEPRRETRAGCTAR
jgi:hypothetical protein